MSSYISSATVIFVSKSVGQKRMSSATIHLGPNCGWTVSQATEFLYKSPIIKFNLREFNILSITFNYSEL